AVERRGSGRFIDETSFVVIAAIFFLQLHADLQASFARRLNRQLELIGACGRRARGGYVAEAVGFCSFEIVPGSARNTTDGSVTARGPGRCTIRSVAGNEQVAACGFVTCPDVAYRLGRIPGAKALVE